MDNITTAYKMLQRGKGQEIEVDSHTGTEDIAKLWKESLIKLDSFRKRQPAILEGIGNKEELEADILAQLDGLDREERELLLYDTLREADPEAQLLLYQLPQLALLLNKPPEWTDAQREGETPTEWAIECHKKRMDAVKAIDHYRERKRAIQSSLKGCNEEELRAIIYDTADRIRKAEQ